MKYFLYLSLLFFISPGVIAQDKTKALNISPQLSIFSAKGKDLGKSFNPINPGGEILYVWGLNNKLSLLSGINYSYSTWTYSLGVKSNFKRLAHEFYIPVLIESKIKQKFFIELGMYPGWLLKGKELYKNNIDIKNWRDNTKYTNYESSTKFSTDLFISLGITDVINENCSLHFAPFIKYKIKDNWFGEIRQRISFGLKFSFSIDIQDV